MNARSAGKPAPPRALGEGPPIAERAAVALGPVGSRLRRVERVSAVPARYAEVDPWRIRPINSLFGLSFETVTALGGGHFAHRPCRDLVIAAALRPGT
jgi:hypothetical protein